MLIPNLLSYRLSCVVTDPKGELAKLTGKFRKFWFQHTVIYLNPFGLHKLGSGSLNPLDFIDNGEDFLDQCRVLANMLVVRTGTETDPHWNDSAELVLTAIIAFVCGCEPDRSRRTLNTVRLLLSSRHCFASAIEVMQQTDACQGVIRRLGGQLTWYQDRELGSVLSTVQRHTQFLDSPLIAHNTKCSSFHPMLLRRGRATVYLILPADKLSSLAGLQRMWIGTIMRVITSGPPTEKHPVLWLLDEMAHIGHVQAITDAVTLMRGMGMRLWFFFQSREQLKACFGEKGGTVLDNIGTQQYFSINSYETADEISKRVGDTTVAICTGGTTTSTSTPVGGTGPNGNQPGSRSTSSNVNRSEIARRLLKPEEILTLSKDVTLIFSENLPVIPARLVRYYRDREFRWGRCGRQPGLGIASGLVAASLLVVSLGFSQLAGRLAGLPSSLPNRATAASPGTLAANGRQRAGTVPPAKRYPVRPAQRRSTHGMPGRSGFLIEIK